MYNLYKVALIMVIFVITLMYIFSNGELNI